MRLLLRALALSAAITTAGNARASTDTPQDDGVSRLLARLETVAQSDGRSYAALLTESADPARAAAFAATELAAGITRAVIQEQGREELAGTLPGEGYRVVVSVFEEFGAHARIATWRLDLKHVGEPDTDTDWLIADQERMTSIEELNRLSLNPAKQFAVRHLRIAVQDLDLEMAEGSVFVAEIGQGVTALLLAGRGEMRFHPDPEAEKSQLRIFCGAEVVATRFDSAYLRINPADFDGLMAGELTPVAVDPREFRRAERVFREEAPNSFGLELGDLSRDTWSLTPVPGDLVADIRTRRFGTLTYTRSSSDAEDINFFQRARRKTISSYASSQTAAGAVARAEYDVLHYDIDVSAAPDRRWIEGRARLSLRVRANAISNVALRLADSLVVTSVVSEEFGRLFGLRVKNQNSLVVGLPAAVLRDTDLTFTITYAGRLEPQSAAVEVLAPSAALQQPELVIAAVAEPSFLYSNQSNWYPQPSASQYATATLRITVPLGFVCVATGELAVDSPALQPGSGSSPDRRSYVFKAAQPVRYLAFIVSRFVSAHNVAIGFGPPTANTAEPRSGLSYRALEVRVEANPRQVSRGRQIGARAVDMALFYQSLLDDCPYPSFTVALVESQLPGGHSPGYFAVLNEPVANGSLTWRNDPASFESYPDSFIAHEMAHQWWGQAVGWSTYHEQWLSEGFAQYFAALYAQRQRGDDVFASVMRQMRKWAMAESEEGPIWLGYRLGHIRGSSRTFRALVYNKGALVLHMLRRLVGDEAFFRGLRRFYRTSRFRSASTADFRSAMEEEAGRSLVRFFDRWIYGSSLPRLKVSSRIEGDELAVRIEQMAEVFDVPLTLTLRYADGTTAEVVVPATERIVTARLPLAGPLRGVEVSSDDGTLADIVRD